jgi:hypothetical protein
MFGRLLLTAGSYLWRSSQRTIICTGKKEDRKQDCKIWIVHLYAEDWKDFVGSRGDSPLRQEQVGQLV